MLLSVQTLFRNSQARELARRHLCSVTQMQRGALSLWGCRAEALSLLSSPLEGGRRGSRPDTAWQGPPPFLGCLGDTQFSFRIRQCGGQRSPWATDDRHYDSRAPMSLQVRMGCLSSLFPTGRVQLVQRPLQGAWACVGRRGTGQPRPAGSPSPARSPSLNEAGPALLGTPRVPGALPGHPAWCAEASMSLQVLPAPGLPCPL